MRLVKLKSWLRIILIRIYVFVPRNVDIKDITQRREKDIKKPSIKKLDSLWSNLIRVRAGSMCEYDGCGKKDRLNSHHIFSRSNRATRWDSDNGICLCVSHHVFGNFSAHKAPLEFAEWMKEKRGDEWFERLRKKASSIVKNQDLKEIREGLKEELKTYESSI